ncbi:MAG: glutamate cyclase domain-containing protein [Pseudomonadota bacterium]
MTELELSAAIEALLVTRNPRGMQHARSALTPGYYFRAAGMLRAINGTVIIATGFPVTGTFETDGPLGAIALYRCLETLGAEPLLACGPPLADSLQQDYRVMELHSRTLDEGRLEARQQLDALQPAAIVAIERPGLAADGRYYNMRGEDISARCFCFDAFMLEADCPTIAIGDGGNEIGMGNIQEAIVELQVRTSVTRCDELLVADVSNWGAYGLIAFLGLWNKRDLLAELQPVKVLHYLSQRGAVDGVTRENTLTEDGLEARVGLHVIRELQALVKDCRPD